MGGGRSRRKGTSQPNANSADKGDASSPNPSDSLPREEERGKHTSGGRASSSVRRVQIAVETESQPIDPTTPIDSIATPRRTPVGEGALSRHSSDMNDFQEALDELAAERHAHIAGDTIDPERTYLERMSTPVRRPGSRNSGTTASANLDDLAAEKHAHIDINTMDPERTYVERMTTPRRAHSSDASRTPSVHPPTLDELAAERHAHIASDTIDPERTYMERIKSPRRLDDSQCGTFDDLIGIKYARISDDTVDPEHTYVERIRSPRRAEDGCETLQEFDQVKHAHIDNEAASPKGLVARSPTPVADFEDGDTNSNSNDRDGVMAAFQDVIHHKHTDDQEAVRNALRSARTEVIEEEVGDAAVAPSPHIQSPTVTVTVPTEKRSSIHGNNGRWAKAGYYAVVGIAGAAIVARLLLSR